MVIPQNIDLGGLLVIAVALVCLCLVGLLLMFGLQFLGSIFGVVFGLVDIVGSLIGGGPVSWCGCLVLVFVCVLCAGGALLITNCNANPGAMNFCLLLPR